MTDKEKLAYIAGRLRGIAGDWMTNNTATMKTCNELAEFALREEKQ